MLHKPSRRFAQQAQLDENQETEITKYTLKRRAKLRERE